MNPCPCLTDAERRALDNIASFHTVMVSEVIADGPSRESDVRELTDKVHQLQTLVMSQVAARAHPDEFRVLGGEVRGCEG